MSTQKVTSEICCITLNMTDRLRLVGCPPELTPEIRQAVTQSWGSILNERDYHGSHEFKLKGDPWIDEGKESVRSRILFVAILSTMARNGYNLIQSAGISKKTYRKDSLFFERAQPDPDVKMFAVSFNKEDRIRIINAPELMTFVKDAVNSTWSAGIQSEREYHGSLELKLKGAPWQSINLQTVQSRLLLSQIIANFRSVGYKLYASADITEVPSARDLEEDPEFQGNLESWVFRKTGANWQ